jgi:RNA polymerase sigma-70 factor (ECF subfamily)
MRSEVSAHVDEFLAAHASLVTRLHAQADAARWDVSREEFAAALHRSAVHRFGSEPPRSNPLDEYLGSLHLADLALACALRKASEPAWEEFVARYRPVLYAAARAITGSAGEARARELADSLYAELYGLAGAGGARSRPLLDYFHGRSKLATWLRAVLAQRHVDSLRAGRRTESLDEDTPPPGRTADRGRTQERGTPDPDRSRLLPRLEMAISDALAALPPPDRLLLSLYYVRELTLAQIARLQGVHEATASRQLERIRRELRQQVEQVLAAKRPAVDGRAALPGLSPAEVQLCFTYAVEDWAFDLGSALADGAGRKHDAL